MPRRGRTRPSERGFDRSPWDRDQGGEMSRGTRNGCVGCIAVCSCCGIGPAAMKAWDEISDGASCIENCCPCFTCDAATVLCVCCEPMFLVACVAMTCCNLWRDGNAMGDIVGGQRDRQMLGLGTAGAGGALAYGGTRSARTRAAARTREQNEIRNFKTFEKATGGGPDDIAFRSNDTGNMLVFSMENDTYSMNMFSNGELLLGGITNCLQIGKNLDLLGRPGKPGGSVSVSIGAPSTSLASNVNTLFTKAQRYARRNVPVPVPKEMHRRLEPATKIVPATTTTTTTTTNESDDMDDDADDEIRYGDYGDLESILLPIAKAAFAKFDTDGSGGLDEAEVRALFDQVLGEPVEDDDFSGVFEAMDRNSDGKIDFEEYKRYLPKFPKVSRLAELAFQSMDKNADDRVTKAELQQAFTQFGVNDEDKVDRFDVDSLFEDLDSDENGAVSFTEFGDAFQLLLDALKDQERKRKKQKKKKKKKKKQKKKQKERH